MQIHELPAQSTTNNSDELAIDTGLTTQRVNVETLGKKITEDAAPAFTSGDASDPSSWTDVTALSSGTAMKAILNKISTMFKNIRYLYKMLGTADISAIDNGTVTGAISKLNTDLNGYAMRYKTGTITIPDGTSLPSSTDINITDILPSGYSAFGVVILLNSYALPYFSSASVGTYVQTLTNNYVRIVNRTTAWSNYTYYMTLICKKN